MNNKYIALGIIIGLLFISLVILFCILLGKLYIKKIKEHNQKELDFQKNINEAILETQEQVLNNISQDLHDDAGQQLTYINFQIENLKFDSPELNSQLEPLSQSVNNLSQSIRSISHALNNQLLLQQDLLKAITTEVERLQKNPKITIQLDSEESIQKVFTANEKIVIYRIFQELINNTLKHSKATKIDIVVRAMPHFTLQVSDNGKGFEVNATTKQSLGLANMKSRAAIIEYQLEIKSKIGEGTTVILSENIK
ncbi:sensor histidine kinase [Flavobacterium sp.]|uniref:sensor histidine kinase n=1 Tax=Flavobacterium sp. TaxID=239 RepID=UPI002B4B0821|nr:ATP-binding protein [Flavobacterium sp.]HLP64735.1 ATP-binding protein [Flavobacterium sp.]